MNKLALVLAVCGVVYLTKLHKSDDLPRLDSHDKVIMYSLTTCGYCKAKGRELRQAGIRYTEYFIDKDNARMNELNSKLKNSGLPPRSYGTPILDVKGFMLPNNPSMSKIRRHLAKVT